TTDLAEPSTDLRCVFEAILKYVPAPRVALNAPLQMQVTTLDYSDYVGRIAIGRVNAGSLKSGESVTVIDRKCKHQNQRVLQRFQFEGLSRREVERVEAGDICAVVGLDPIDIGDTIACREQPAAMVHTPVDPPTLHMTFRVNDGPFAGREGEYVTCRQIRE